MVRTAGQSYGLIHQLLEGACFLSVGSGWVFIHQILRSSGKGGIRIGYFEVSIQVSQNETVI